uniref:Uncharacterized protein n=1 Tax=Eutreptiella gymnastica TaxID=73025 RepID=A0A7S4D2H2_9EUGL
MAMLVGGILATHIDVGLAWQARLQNLSAGILIMAMAELFHELDEDSFRAAGGRPLIGIVIGFSLSAMVLFGISALTDGDDEEDEDGLLSKAASDRSSRPLEKEEANEIIARLDRIKCTAATMRQMEELALLDVEDYMFQMHEATSFTTYYVGANVISMDEDMRNSLASELAQAVVSAKDVSSHIKATKVKLRTAVKAKFKDRLRALQMASNMVNGLKKSVEKAKLKKGVEKKSTNLGNMHMVPWSLVASVVIDAASDGFLLGIAYLASINSCIVLAVGCSFEMGFVGWTFCATLPKKIPLWLRTVLAVSPPVTIAAASLCGATVGAPLKQYPTCFAILVSFGLSSIMFLVTQELLPEAHENQKDGRRWNINVWLFIGVVGVLLLHSFLPEEDDPTGVQQMLNCPNEDLGT